MKKILISIFIITMISSCTNKNLVGDEKIEKINVKVEKKQGSADVITPVELSNQPNL